jgi:hypothetical protein
MEEMNKNKSRLTPLQQESGTTFCVARMNSSVAESAFLDTYTLISSFFDIPSLSLFRVGRTRSRGSVLTSVLSLFPFAFHFHSLQFISE